MTCYTTLESEDILIVLCNYAGGRLNEGGIGVGQATDISGKSCVGEFQDSHSRDFKTADSPYSHTAN